MSIIFLLILVIWTLQGMNQDKNDCYIQGLCTQAESRIKKKDFELAFHLYHTAIQFYTLRKLNNTDMLCDVLTRLGNMYYLQWLKHKSVKDLSGASDCFKKAVQYNYAPALESFGLLSIECGNFQEAIEYLDKAAQDGCNTALNYRRIGLCYNQIEDNSQAELFWGKAYRLGDQESFKLAQML